MNLFPGCVLYYTHINYNSHADPGRDYFAFEYA